MIDRDAFERAGLYDPTAPNAAQRLELLEFLVGEGVSLERMAATHASDEHTLTGVLADGLLRPGEAITLVEVARRLDLPPETVERTLLAVGIPVRDHSAAVLRPEDVDTFAAFQFGVAMFGERAMLQLGRVIGSSVARIAEAAVWLYTEHMEQPIVESAQSEVVLAKANVEATQSLTVLAAAIEHLFRVHAELAIRHVRAARAGLDTYTTARLAIGFVDLVGYTGLAERAETEELARVIDHFEALAYDVVTERNGRVVKLIGDEVMFVALDPTAACDIALTLLEAHADHEEHVTPRGGVAFGELLIRGADYYGSTVNLASRIGDLAVPHEILATAELRDAVAGYAFAPAGRRLLKGFDEPVELFSLSRSD